MERIQGANPRTHLTVVVGGIATALLALAAIWSVPGLSGTRGDAANPASPLSFGRSTLSTTPGAELSGELEVGPKTKESTVHWRVYSNGKFGQWHASRRYAVFAPTSGTFTISANAEVAGKVVTTKLDVTVAPVASFIATDVHVSKGTVLVDGELAIDGEALSEGTHIDATDGTIAYSVAATTNSKLRGDIEFSGTQFTISTKNVGDRRLNLASVDRDPHGATVQLNAEVEHLDGVRYQAVATPDALAMVKGTGFDVVVAPDSSNVEVDHGVVRVLDRLRLFADAEDVEGGDSANIETIPGQEALEDTGAAFDPSPWIGDADIDDDDSDVNGADGYIDPDDALIDAVDETLNNRDTGDLQDRYKQWKKANPSAPAVDPDTLVDTDGDGIPDAIDKQPNFSNGDPTKLPPPDCGTCAPLPGMCTAATNSCGSPCATCSGTKPPPTCLTCAPCPDAGCEPAPCTQNCLPECPSTGCTTEPCKTCTEPPPPTCNTCTDPPPPCDTCNEPPPPAPPPTCETCVAPLPPPPLKDGTNIIGATSSIP